MILFLISSVFFVSNTYGQNEIGINLYSTWIKLSLSGKSQGEIENFLREVPSDKMQKVKQQLRLAVIENLRRLGIQNIVRKSKDSDDLNVARRKIITEIRYAGLEQDYELKMAVKNEFGINLGGL